MRSQNSSNSGFAVDDLITILYLFQHSSNSVLFVDAIMYGILVYHSLYPHDGYRQRIPYLISHFTRRASRLLR